MSWRLHIISLRSELFLLHAHLEDFCISPVSDIPASGYVLHVAHIGTPNSFVACKKTAGCSVLLSVISVKQ